MHLDAIEPYLSNWCTTRLF